MDVAFMSAGIPITADSALSEFDPHDNQALEHSTTSTASTSQFDPPVAPPKVPRTTTLTEALRNPFEDEREGEDGFGENSAAEYDLALSGSLDNDDDAPGGQYNQGFTGPAGLKDGDMTAVLELQHMETPGSFSGGQWEKFDNHSGHLTNLGHVTSTIIDSIPTVHPSTEGAITAPPGELAAVAYLGQLVGRTPGPTPQVGEGHGSHDNGRVTSLVSDDDIAVVMTSPTDVDGLKLRTTGDSGPVRIKPMQPGYYNQNTAGGDVWHTEAMSSNGGSDVIDTQPLPIRPPPRPVRYLGSSRPIEIICSSCHQLVVTSLEYKAGTCTYVACMTLALVGCAAGCCLVPFALRGCKDAIHKCPQCHYILGKYKRC